MRYANFPKIFCRTRGRERFLAGLKTRQLPVRQGFTATLPDAGKIFFRRIKQLAESGTFRNRRLSKTAALPGGPRNTRWNGSDHIAPQAAPVTLSTASMRFWGCFSRLRLRARIDA